MGKRNSEFWDRYEELSLQVAGYGQAFEFCTWFVINNCRPLKAATERLTRKAQLVDILLSLCEAKENYEDCARLLPFRSGFDISKEAVTETDIDDYFFNSNFVLFYDDNLEECAEVMWEFGLLSLYPWKPKADDID